MRLKELVASPIISISPQAELREAQKLFERSRVSDLLVKHEEEFLGLLSRSTVESALRFGLSGPIANFVIMTFP